jgi:hypothetical protein
VDGRQDDDADAQKLAKNPTRFAPEPIKPSIYYKKTLIRCTISSNVKKYSTAVLVILGNLAQNLHSTLERALSITYIRAIIR